VRTFFIVSNVFKFYILLHPHKECYLSKILVRNEEIEGLKAKLNHNDDSHFKNPITRVSLKL